MWDALGLVGILVFFAGVHLIWQARDEAVYWLDEYLRLWASVARRMTDLSSPPVAIQPGVRKRDTLRLVLGSLLAFFLAPLFIVMGLAL